MFYRKDIIFFKVCVFVLVFEIHQLKMSFHEKNSRKLRKNNKLILYMRLNVKTRRHICFHLMTFEKEQKIEDAQTLRNCLPTTQFFILFFFNILTFTQITCNSSWCTNENINKPVPCSTSNVNILKQIAKIKRQKEKQVEEKKLEWNKKYNSRRRGWKRNVWWREKNISWRSKRSTKFIRETHNKFAKH